MTSSIERVLRWGVAALAGGFIGLAQAGALDLISTTDASQAVRAALEKGSERAVALLGRPGGYANDPQLHIPLPDALSKSRRLFKMLGKGDELDSLEAAINRAAEQAVPKGKAVLSDTVKKMTVDDAKNILTGGDDSVTQFFRKNSRAELMSKLTPIVDGQISELGIARQYDALAGKGAALGLVKGNDSSLAGYVTDQALEGLFTMIAREEKAIRADPIGTGSKLLGKVFGALR
ncbi:MAG: DUF4197 domain-containing protein [Burkholderiaceae bacterium]